MNEYTIDGIVKREFVGVENAKAWRVAKEVWKHVIEYGKVMEKAGREGAFKEVEEARLKELTSGVVGEGMSDEEYRERFKKNLLKIGASGDFDAAMAGKLIDVLDLKATRAEVPIELVDFREAFPDMAKAIEWCSKPMPEVMK